MNKRESKTQHGLFWRQNDDQRKLWGTLRINENNEATLETFGSLIATEERSPVDLIGQIDPGYARLTLINCFPINTINSLHEPPREEPSNPDLPSAPTSQTRKTPGKGYSGKTFLEHARETNASVLDARWKNTPNWVGSSPSRKGGVVSRGSGNNQKTFQVGWTAMNNQVTESARPQNFYEKPRLSSQTPIFWHTLMQLVDSDVIEILKRPIPQPHEPTT